MKFYITLFLLCFGALGFSAFGQISTVKKILNGKEYIVHTIQKGQTIYSITKLYGITDKDIYAANPGSEVGITAGKDLLIPTKQNAPTNVPPVKEPVVTTVPPIKPPVATNNPPVKPAPTTNQKYVNHTVARSETLYGLSKQYGVTVDALVVANPDVLDGLKVGMLIRIPQGTYVAVSENDAKIDVKEEPKEETDEDTKVIAPAAVIVPDLVSKLKSRKDCINNGSKKSHYTIAVLMPFGNNPRPDNKQARVAFQFYAGVQMAQKMYLPKEASLDWEVYNTGEADDSATIDKLISSGSLDNADIILGPLYSSGLYQVAAYAAKRKIPVLSPTSRMSAVLEGNPYLIKTTPSPESFLVGLAEYMTQRFDHIILVEPAGVEDSLTMKALQAELNLLVNVKNPTKSISYVEAGKGSPIDLVKPGVKNLIYYPTKKELAVTNFLTGLRKLKSSGNVAVMGDESWLRFRNFDPEYYSNVGLQVPILHFSTPQISGLDPFVKKFREEYKTDPEIYAFRGYDAACYVTDMLENYGNSLPECIRFDTPKYLFSPFMMMKKQGGGFDNKGITVLVIEDYSLRLETN